MVRYSGVVMASVVALRLALGFHFYFEGVAKLKDPKPFSAMFLGAAKGPLAGKYQAMVYDADGDARLDADETARVWADFVEKAKRKFQLDEAQGKRADEILARREAQMRGFLASIDDDVEEYRKGLKYIREADRKDRPDDKRSRVEVASLKGQWDKTESELKAKRGPWLANLDKLGKGLEADINGLSDGRGAIAAARPGARFLDSDHVDKFIPYFDLTVGALLVLGLFVRVAATAGGLFLLSVVLSQWPGTPGAAPVYYQSVEMFAMFVMAAIGAGQFGGLDFFWANCCSRKCCSKTAGCATKTA